MDLANLPYALNPMRLSDVPTVESIEQQVFATPWSAQAFRQELTFHTAATYLVLRYTEQAVLERRYPRRPWSGPHDPSIIGYGGLWIVLDQGHVSTLAVRTVWRGHGLGELLFAALIETAIAQGCDELTLEVRLSNRIAQNLYAKYGLEVAGRRPRYYPDNQEDAWIMTSPPLQSPAFLTTFASLVERLHQRLVEAVPDGPTFFESATPKVTR